jgi:glycosyltransferase involved in cell wall biosynthesis
MALKGAGGPDEIITHKVDGILTSKELYSQEMFQLLLNQEELKSMKIKARNKVEKHFSLNTTIILLEKSIRSIDLINTNNED